MITLEHVAITTTPDKFAATVKFYRDVFGLRTVRETPEFVFLSDGQGGRIEVQAYGEPALPHPSHLAFGVPLEQFDALVASVRDAGARVDDPRTTASGDRLCYFDDPAGNRAQVVARKSPLPP